MLSTVIECMLAPTQQALGRLLLWPARLLALAALRNTVLPHLNTPFFITPQLLPLAAQPHQVLQLSQVRP